MAAGCAAAAPAQRCGHRRRRTAAPPLPRLRRQLAQLVGGHLPQGPLLLPPPAQLLRVASRRRRRRGVSLELEPLPPDAAAVGLRLRLLPHAGAAEGPQHRGLSRRGLEVAGIKDVEHSPGGAGRGQRRRHAPQARQLVGCRQQVVEAARRDEHQAAGARQLQGRQLRRAQRRHIGAVPLHAAPGRWRGAGGRQLAASGRQHLLAAVHPGQAQLQAPSARCLRRRAAGQPLKQAQQHTAAAGAQVEHRHACRHASAHVRHACRPLQRLLQQRPVDVQVPPGLVFRWQAVEQVLIEFGKARGVVAALDLLHGGKPPTLCGHEEPTN